MNKKIKEKAIYKITNIVNGKIYIGQSIRPERRWVEHKNKAKYLDDQYPIHLAINKYGEENFTFEILEWTSDYDNREIELIKEYNSLCPNGYNVAEGGNTNAMYGEDHPRNKVKDIDLPLIIKDLKENKLTDREIAKKYNLTDKIISDINHGLTHIIKGEKYPIRVKHGSQKLTIEQVIEIKKLLEENILSYDKIAEKYNVSKGTIYHINKGLTFKEDRVYPIRESKR